METNVTFAGILATDNFYEVAWMPSGRHLSFKIGDEGVQGMIKAFRSEPPEYIVLLETEDNVPPMERLMEALRAAGFAVEGAALFQVQQIAHLGDADTVDAESLAIVASRVRRPGVDFDPKDPRPSLAQIWPPPPRIEVPDPGESLWRFMDFTKFMSLLERAALYFSSARKFLDVDPFEGSYPRENSLTEQARRTGMDLAGIIRARASLLDRYFINCWHLSESESAALWVLYGPRQSAIAVRSTFSALRKSIVVNGPHEQLFFAKVKYLDYSRDKFPGQLADLDMTPFFHKRKSFEHERELRIIATHGNSPVFGNVPETGKQQVVGYYLPVDLRVLLQAVYMPPRAEDWFHELMKSVLSRHRLSQVLVERSSLSDNPTY
jgi:hypothetical protein